MVLLCYQLLVLFRRKTAQPSFGAFLAEAFANVPDRGEKLSDLEAASLRILYGYPHTSLEVMTPEFG